MHRNTPFLTPPHLMIRPSLLAVGPFTKTGDRTALIKQFIQTLPRLQKSLPQLHLFLVGPGATDCFKDAGSPPSLVLEDSEKELESYIFYVNVLIRMPRSSPLEESAIGYAAQFKRPTVSIPRLPLFYFFKRSLVNQVLAEFPAPSSHLNPRAYATSS